MKFSVVIAALAAAVSGAPGVAPVAPIAHGVGHQASAVVARTEHAGVAPGQVAHSGYPTFHATTPAVGASTTTVAAKNVHAGIPAVGHHTFPVHGYGYDAYPAYGHGYDNDVEIEAEFEFEHDRNHFY